MNKKVLLTNGQMMKLMQIQNLKTTVQSENSTGNCSYCREVSSESFDVIQCSDSKAW